MADSSGEEAGNSAGAAHGRGRADIAADERGGDEQVGRGVEEGRGFAAVFADVVVEVGVVAVVVAQG